MRALDLFCGAGGASMGLHRAGFDVTGIDIVPQPHYPFRFVQADALRPPFRLEDFDFIWASPPCQAFSKTHTLHRNVYPDLIAPLRVMLQSCKAWTIENVPGAPLNQPVMLCGTMFGLRVLRHRHFEANFKIPPLSCGRHGRTNSHRGYSTGEEFICVAGHNYRRVEGAAAMGIDWMHTRDELSEAVPPAYSFYVAQAFACAGQRSGDHQDL